MLDTVDIWAVTFNVRQDELECILCKFESEGKRTETGCGASRCTRSPDSTGARLGGELTRRYLSSRDGELEVGARYPAKLDNKAPTCLFGRREDDSGQPRTKQLGIPLGLTPTPGIISASSQGRKCCYPESPHDCRSLGNPATPDQMASASFLGAHPPDLIRNGKPRRLLRHPGV